MTAVTKTSVSQKHVGVKSNVKEALELVLQLSVLEMESTRSERKLHQKREKQRVGRRMMML